VGLGALGPAAVANQCRNLVIAGLAYGTETKVTVRRHESCEDCRGSGAAAGKAPVTCRSCSGRGQVRYQQGFFSIARTCPTCQGTGSVITDPCPKCKGEGRLLRQRTVDAKIPAGVEDGTRIRFSGFGEGGLHGGPPGDLFVVLKVAEHPIFERHESDLHCTVPINIAQAALGASIDILTFDGLQTIKIPEDGANCWVRHRQSLLARALAEDQPVEPPQGEAGEQHHAQTICGSGKEIEETHVRSVVHYGCNG
jgi:DnaJ-class molecular chaperone